MFFLLACTDPPADDTAPVAPPYDPGATGAWIAGTDEDSFVGPTGVTHAVQVWFPASEADDDLYEYDDLITGAAHDDATPDCSEARPVLVFSHGSGGIRWQSLYLTEHLASRGWVVVAVDHTGNTIFDDGAVTIGEMALRRPIDAVASYDWLVDTDGGGRLAGCLDPDAGFAISGHSFGGYTTLAVSGAYVDAAASADWCAEHGGWLCSTVAQAMDAEGLDIADGSDPRVWAAVAMAPAGYEALVGGLSAIAVPSLLLGGSRDTLTPMDSQVRPLYEGIVATPRALGELTDAGHYTFSDACDFVPTFEDCAAPFLQAEDAHPILAATTTAWLDAARGIPDADAWLPPEEPLLIWEQP